MEVRNRLKGSFTYMAGGIDEVPDCGISWRKMMSEWLWDLEIGVFNPCDKPTNFAKEDIPARDTLNEMRKNKDYAGMQKIMKDIVSADLHMVDLSTFLIVYIDKDIHMCGSYSEITYASCLEKKPIIICCKQGVENIPGWIWGICDYKLFFSSWIEVKKYITKVAFSKDFQDPSWRFIDYDKVFGRGE